MAASAPFQTTIFPFIIKNDVQLTLLTSCDLLISMSITDEDAPKGMLGQRLPNGSSKNSEDPSSKRLQKENGFYSNQEELDRISPVEEPVVPRETSNGSPDTSPANDASATIRRSISGSRCNTQSPNLDNPFALFESMEKLNEGVQYFAFRHDLTEKFGVLKRAALIVRDEMEAFQDPSFPEEEKTALEKEREATFWQQSRSLRGAVLIIGTLSAMCQGWTQSVLNGSGICTNGESSCVF
jgi:hypothetical protein